MDNIDSMDEIITMGSKDYHHPSMIMKGKRTKRPRQPSPTSTVFTASSCSSGGDGGGGGGGGGNKKLLSKIQSSDSLCSEILSTSREEDEDMANCLILLARSGKQNTMMSTTIQINNNIEKQGGDNIKSEKIDRKKFKEATTTTSTIRGKDGTYVYECKTCNRSFISFQALGGHRTSHKKHKPTVEIEDKKVKILPPLFDDDDRHEQKKQYEEQEKGMKFLKISPSSLLSLELGNKKSHGNAVINNKVKIHECSICGAEFSSGQALGGHMRRHRNTTSITTTTTDPSHDDVGERPRNRLELDLNLPAAPEDDDLHDSQFQFSLFSSPSLVNCQY